MVGVHDQNDAYSEKVTLWYPRFILIYFSKRKQFSFFMKIVMEIIKKRCRFKNHIALKKSEDDLSYCHTIF